MRGACQAPASTRPDSDGFAAARRALEWRSRGRRPPRRAKCARVRVTATRGTKVRNKQKPPAPPPLPLAADPIAFHVLSRHCYSVGPLLLTYHFGGQPPPKLTRQTSQITRAKIAATATPKRWASARRRHHHRRIISPPLHPILHQDALEEIAVPQC